MEGEFKENLDINSQEIEANIYGNEIKRLKKEIELRDDQIDTLKKASEGKKDNLFLQQKIVELNNYNEDLKKFQLDKDFQINELNNILENKEREIASLKEKIKNNDKDSELKYENDKLIKEINKLNSKINDFEIKFYKANDDKAILEKHNKELQEKINNNDNDVENLTKDYEFKLKGKEEEIIDLRNKITELETIIEEKDLEINNIKEEIITNNENQEENENEYEEGGGDDENKEIHQIESLENLEINKENKLNEFIGIENENQAQNQPDLNKNIEKNLHEEILYEKQNEIENLINTINLITRDKEELENKIFKMKNSVQEITDRLEIEVEKHNKIIDEKNDLIQKEIKLAESLKLSEDKNTKMRIIIKGLSKEKSDLEDLIVKQEAKVSDLAAKVKIVEKNFKEKNKEISDNEDNSLKLVQIIEEQKKEIESLTKSSIAHNNNNKIVLSTKDEIQLKKLIAEKDSEIISLKLYNDNLKLELQHKEQNITNMQKTLSRYQEEIRRLKLNKADQGNKNENRKENENKNNMIPSGKQDNKRIKIESKDLNNNQIIENLLKNKKQAKNSAENTGSDFKLPDINKNQKLPVIKKSVKEEKSANEEMNLIFKEENEMDINLLSNKQKEIHKKSLHSKKIHFSPKKYIFDEEDKNTDIEYKNKEKKNKEEKNRYIDVNKNSDDDKEIENDNNINEISNMMKQILNHDD